MTRQRLFPETMLLTLTDSSSEPISAQTFRQIRTQELAGSKEAPGRHRVLVRADDRAAGAFEQMR